MEISAYKKEFAPAFAQLNFAWLNKYFTPEPADFAVLNDLQAQIDAGGMAFFALEEGKVISACLVVPLQNDVWEICKFATDEHYRRRGAGSALLAACMQYAAAHGAKKLMIVSHTVLQDAVRLYRKMGFEEVPVTDRQFERVNIQFERRL